MAVANGEGDIAIVNSYYLGIMLSGSSGKKQLNAAKKKLRLYFPIKRIEEFMLISVGQVY